MSIKTELIETAINALPPAHEALAERVVNAVLDKLIVELDALTSASNPNVFAVIKAIRDETDA